jgi:acyl-coenzyme A thioesterase PaaI-like protein
LIHPLIRHEPDHDNPGWWTWDLPNGDRYNATIGKLLVRGDGPHRARCRIVPATQQSNLGNVVHGGAILTFIDMALFAGGHMAGVEVHEAVTLDMSAQFISPGELDVPLECSVELLRETGRLAFLRGLVEQEAKTVASWSATLRKGAAPR